jgi:hypothetical protein
VGRLTALQGAVSFAPSSDTEWTAAEANRPVTTGDRLWSDNDGRAEIDIGSAVVRLWYQTELDVTRLDDRMLQVRLPEGSATIRVSSLAEGEDVEIDTPNASILLGGVGVYRINVSADGLTTTVSVWSGTADVTSAGSSFALTAQQMATVRGDTAPTYDVGPTGGTDGFDQWSQSRDDREDRTTAARRYVPSDMPGAGDLDDYGEWNTDPNYGPVWYPRGVSATWAPYHDGHWAWVGRWGWTWVDDAPWGYAPSHYGRWARVNDRWGWCPGRVIAPAVFSPGLVVFVGGGSTWGRASFGASVGIAWFPLAPEEIYRPAYPVSDAYIRRVNITNVTNVTNITNITNITNVTNVTYRNRGVLGAVTAVPRNAFENAAPVARVAVRVSEADLQQAKVVGAAPAFVPGRASLVAEAARRNSSKPPTQLGQRAVVAIHAPPPAPVPFATQAAAIAAHGGRPLSSQELSNIRKAAPASPTVAMPTPPVRSAIDRPASGAALKPARAGLPEARAAVAGARPARPVTPPRAAAAPEPARPAAPPPANAKPVPAPKSVPPTPARPEAPVAAPRPPVARPPVSLGSKSLDTSYATQREKLEAKHVQQFAKPPAGVSPKTLAEKQDSEHAALEARYHQAAVAGKPAMPAADEPVPPRARAARPSQRPTVQPKAPPVQEAKPKTPPVQEAKPKTPPVPAKPRTAPPKRPPGRPDSSSKRPPDEGDRGQRGAA